MILKAAPLTAGKKAVYRSGNHITTQWPSIRKPFWPHSLILKPSNNPTTAKVWVGEGLETQEYRPRTLRTCARHNCFDGPKRIEKRPGVYPCSIMFLAKARLLWTFAKTRSMGIKWPEELLPLLHANFAKIPLGRLVLPLASESHSPAWGRWATPAITENLRHTVGSSPLSFHRPYTPPAFQAPLAIRRTLRPLS